MNARRMSRSVCSLGYGFFIAASVFSSVVNMMTPTKPRRTRRDAPPRLRGPRRRVQPSRRGDATGPESLLAGLFMARVTIRRTYSYREASRWPNYIARASRDTKSGESSGGLAGSTDGYSSTTAIRVRPTPNRSPTVVRAGDTGSARILGRRRGHSTRQPGRGIRKLARSLRERPLCGLK